MNARGGAAALITGANSGIGKEVARQLAEFGGFDRIYLACRNPARAEAAREDLLSTTGRDVFTTIPMDTGSTDSVRAAMDLIGGRLDAVVMNAGGTGGAHPTALTEDGVTEIFASNVLGHVVLLEGLIAADALVGTAVLVGSEAARGVPKFRIPRPTFAAHSVAEFVGVIDGSYFAAGSKSDSLAYAQVKYLGALWISALARRHPQRRLLTVSPGGTSGTDVFRNMPAPARTVMNRVLMPLVLPRLGLAHPIEVGAHRLVDATVGAASYESGTFYASAANTLTGPLVDQAEILADFSDPAIQDHASEAIHRFIR